MTSISHSESWLQGFHDCQEWVGPKFHEWHLSEYIEGWNACCEQFPAAGRTRLIESGCREYLLLMSNRFLQECSHSRYIRVGE